MMETDILGHLVGLLEGRGWNVCQSSIGVIAALARFGRLLCHFVLCKD